MESIEVLFRNDHIIALNKPAGLLSVPGIGPERQDCVASRVREAFPGARIVHRLDRDTSGVILMALDPETHRELSRMFHDREVKKTYVAIVAGIMAQDKGEIDLPMRKDLEAAKATGTPRHIIDHEQGRRALTRWKAQRRYPMSNPLAPGSAGGPPPIREAQSFVTGRNASNPPAEPGAHGSCIPVTRLELTPITGRSHQLRVHLSAIGHPIVGDDIYAPPEVRDAAQRLLLHAESLELADPWSAKPLRFTTPCPF